MQPKSDAQLIREYAEHGSEFAFTEIVTKHTNLVYSAALRLMNSPDGAAEVAQGVFIGLAQRARTLSPQLAADASLSGWLCRSARNIACNLRRDEFRQHSRERQAMEDLNQTSGTTPDWERLRPVLDEAMSELSEADYDALVMRYFSNQDLRSVGQALGVSDDTAQKRVSRALEKLRERLAQHGINSPAAALAVILAANAVQAAPVGLSITLSTAAILAGTPAATTAIVKTIAMTTLQKTLMTVTLAAAVGAGIYQTRQAAVLRGRVQNLQQQQTSLNAQLAQLKTANENFSKQLTEAQTSQAKSQAQFRELIKLRGQMGPARDASRELAKLKSTLGQPGVKLPDYLTNAMANGLGFAEKIQSKMAKARVERMTKALKLTEDQSLAINDLMQQQIKSRSQTTLDVMTGKSAATQLQDLARNRINEAADIQALLTPEQAAAYPQFEQAEKIADANNSATTEAGQLTDDFNLSKEQQAKLHDALYQLSLNEPPIPGAKLAAATKTGDDIEDSFTAVQKAQLDQKLNAFENILTPEQINTYRTEQMDRINMQASAAKMFLPKKADAVSN